MHVAQQLAAEVIEQVFAGRNLTVTLESIFRKHPDITAQQHAVTQDLSYGGLRFYGQSAALLEQLLEKPLPDQRVKCLLLVAIYQLNHDKAAAHTVVDQAVKAAGQFKKSWAKGLVNAVLRNFLRQKDTLLKNIAANEVAFYSYPQWWIDKLKAQYPQQWQAILEAGNAHPPMSLRVNQREMAAVEYSKLLSDAGLKSQLLNSHAIILSKPVPVDKLPDFSQGLVSVQDYGAQFAAPWLDLQDGMRVLDACCAPGGKTGHVLELADVDLVAVDSDAERLQRTQSNLKRLNLSAQLLTGDAANPSAWWDGKPFDRILADVPCTASGIVRRHVDIKWLRREADIASFSKQQAVILRGLWQLLAKGGKLLYVTCSIFHEENQRQIEKFLETQADAQQIPLAHTQHGQLLPCAEHDGFFYALLQKN